MASAEDRISTQVVPADWVPPDERNRALDEDYEAGPRALNDTSYGLFDQPWTLTWDFASGDFTVTPETTGAPVVVHNAVAVTQCSFCFDQNAHVTIAYVSNNLPYLYWYDTQAAGWVVTPLRADATTPTLTLDDKRSTQTNANDITLLYTVEQPDGSFNCIRLLQRQRFLQEKLWITGCPPYIYKFGMHFGFRLQIGFSNEII